MSDCLDLNTAPVLASLHKLGLLATQFIVLQTVDKTIYTSGYMRTQSNYIFRKLGTDNSAAICPFSSCTPILSPGTPPHCSFSPPLWLTSQSLFHLFLITKAIHTKDLWTDGYDWKQKGWTWLKNHIIESICSFSTFSSLSACANSISLQIQISLGLPY